MESLKDCLLSHDMINHDMLCNENTCNEGINTPSSIHVMSDSDYLNKSDWQYLVKTLESWRVFAPRAVVKKNPRLAWHIMTLCKDASVRVPGAYFTTCFKRELFKLENAAKIEALKIAARQKLGIA